MTTDVSPGAHHDEKGGEADVLLVVSMSPEFFNRLVAAGNAFAARMDAEVALSDFCRSLMAMVEPGALVLVVAPSLRQSQEAFRHVSRMYLAAYGVVLDDDTLTSLRLELRNGSRIQVIPGDSDQTSESFGVFTFLGAAKWQHSR